MKKILMAAVAVTALTVGSANALTMERYKSSVGTINLEPQSPSTNTGVEAYSLASEYNVTSSTSIDGKFTYKLAETLQPSTNYVVTFTIAGGTFAPSGVLSVAGTNVSTSASASIAATDLFVNTSADNTAGTAASAPANLASLTKTLGTISPSTAPTSVSFIISTPSGNTQPQFITYFTRGIKPSTAQSNVTISAQIALASSPTVLIDGGATAAQTVLDYRPGLSFQATAANKNLSLISGFKKFGTGATDATSASIGTSVGFKAAGVPTDGLSTNKLYSNLTGTDLATSVIEKAVLTIAGDLSAFNARLGSSQLADTGTTNVITADADNLSALNGATATISLAQKTTPVAGVEAKNYTVTPVVTLSSGLNAPTFAAKALGTVTFEGTSLYAPWVSDGSNGTNNVIRLGNKTTTDISSVKASLLNPTTAGTSGTVASTATCELGTIPASGERVITSANLTTCFGAFKRSDVRLTIQGGEADITAKMRSSTAGVTTENILGGGVSGATAQN